MILGIDPGSSSGAFAIVNNNKAIILVQEFESEQEVVHAIKPYAVSLVGAVLEHVHSMPKQGISSAFKFGANFGFWRGILMALEIPYIMVTPQKWQGSMFDSNKKLDKKIAAMDMAQRLYPATPFTTPRGRQIHGAADAVLMALYGLKIAQF